jgi:putative SOS response-associated peptidase YedK
MCGRYSVMSEISIIVRIFNIQAISSEYKPGNNIAPGQQISAVIYDGVNKLVNFQWGLIPSWAKDPSIGNKMINARAETVSEKPSFREAFKKRRCLIVADGFYEWQKINGKKKPYNSPLNPASLLASQVFMKRGSRRIKHPYVHARSLLLTQMSC